MIQYSALELATICEGSNTQEAIERAIRGAQKVEELGYKRIWFAEHHNMQHIASSATALLIGHAAGKTKTIRVGSGGIMLPNHAPLIIAEQFGTLESIYPGRIDLGLGRAPGTDQLTAMAIRRNNFHKSFYFKDDIEELQQYFNNKNVEAKVRAFPGEGLKLPIYILGSSTDSAYLAADLGLPYAFAAHFAPNLLYQANRIYREHFKSSNQLSSPYFIVCVNTIIGDTEVEAQYLGTSLYNLFCGIITNDRKPLSPPTTAPLYNEIPELAYAVNNMLACTYVGTIEQCTELIYKLCTDLQANEIMTTNYIFDEEKRLASFENFVTVIQNINQLLH